MEGSSNSNWKKSESSRRCFNSSSNAFELSRDSRPGKERERAGIAAHANVIRQSNEKFSEGFEEGELSNDPSIGSAEKGDVSLRHWLDRPNRSVDAYECLHIFRQIVEIVYAAHSQGIVFLNSRPSGFVMPSFNRVSFTESASCSDSGSDFMEDRLTDQTMEVNNLSSPLLKNLAIEEFQLPLFPSNSLLANSSVESGSFHVVRESLIKGAGKPKDKDIKNVNLAEDGKASFPNKKILVLESSWYISPEEASGSPSSCSSDIYRLGVLLFELFCPFSSREEKIRTMSSLRHRVLPPQLLMKWPKEASFCLWLLHPEPSCRPKLSELLQSEILIERQDEFEEREAVLKLEERVEQQELLLEFLLLIQKRKQEATHKLHDTISLLHSDIEDVLKQLKIHHKNTDSHAELDIDSNDTSDSGARKRFRSRVQVQNDEACDEYLDSKDKSDIIDKCEGKNRLRHSRLRNNFKKIESVYLLMRSRQINRSRRQFNGPSQPISSDRRGSSMVVNERSSGSISAPKVLSYGRQGGWTNGFLDGLCKYLSFSNLNVKADLKQGDLLNSFSLVSTLTFDRDGDFFATAGINKKIKIFEYEGIVSEDRDINYPVVEMVSRSKLSSICWNSYIKCQIASSNFDGVVQVWDVTRSQVLMEMREHEKRVWSVDYSSADPTIFASGGDDGCVKLWSINQAKSIGTIKTTANVCCVQFPSNSSRTLSFGSADHKIYYYDLRNSKFPLCTIVGHNKTVSYVKFIDSMTLVSASTDNSLRLWDLSMCASRTIDTPIQSYTGHLNVKNFVGLSVSNGFIATGSETNEIYVYHKAFPMPVLSYKFHTDQLSNHDINDAAQFVSAVCWRGNSSTLIAANSTGNIKVLEMA